MTIITANVELNANSRIFANSSANAVMIKSNTSKHYTVNSSIITSGSATINSLGYFVSSDRVPSKYGIGQYVIVSKDVTQPNGTIMTDVAYPKASYSDFWSVANTYTSNSTLPSVYMGGWQATGTANTTLRINNVVYGNNKFVAACQIGKIYTSDDGYYWTNRTSATSNNLYGAAYGNGVYVTVGNLGTIQSSTDGITWTLRTAANTNAVLSTAYGNGIFVAVGSGGAIQSSTDGTTWTNRTGTNLNAQQGVVYGNNLWISVSSSGEIQRSTDGITWVASVSSNTNALYSVAYGNGVYVTTGSAGVVQTSTDGITFTRPNTQSVFTSIVIEEVTYGSGIFMAVCGTLTGVSTDGVSWYRSNGNPASTSTKYAAAFGGNTFVCAGANNTIHVLDYDFNYDTHFKIKPLPVTSDLKSYMRSQ